MAPSARSVVGAVLGTKGDQDILEYVIGVLSDEDFEFGSEAEEAYEQFGEMLVEGGIVADEDTAIAACKKLQAKLRPNGLAGEGASTGSGTGDGFKALTSGPVALKDVDDQPLLHKKQSASHMIQTQMGDKTETGAYRLTPAEEAKARKKAEKEMRLRMLAYQHHQAQVKAALGGGTPKVVRNQGGPAIRDIHLENFSISNGGEELISDGNVTFAFGRRYGLVGRNGTGKTTFLRALSSHSLKGLPKNCQVLHVEQEVQASDVPAIEVVLRCDSERSALMKEEKELQAALATAKEGSPEEETKSARLSEVYTRLKDIDADGAEARAATILSGLSFTDEMMGRGTNKFSGGWRMRIALAQALFVEPDFLLLDEPTNHLDLHAVLWLEEYLLKWKKTVLVVSHAREFLNTVCTNILHLHSHKLTTYVGNYATFEKTAAERIKNQLKQAEAVEAQRKHMQDFIDKFRYNAKRASLVQSRIKALERLAEVAVVERDPEYVFDFPDPGVGGITSNVAGFTDVEFNYPGGPTLFKGLNFGIDLQSRFAIVGDNGVGKSTLLNLIAGKLDPVDGVVNRNNSIRWAEFSQHHVDGLDLTLNPLQYMCKEYPLVKDQELRTYLGQFGLGGDLALQPMYTLSGGQKSRVAFAKVCFPKPHMLLLDEPSNHLDMDAVDALIEGLTKFPGGVLMVSHDQYLIEACVDRLWMAEEKAIIPFDGTFQEYKDRLRKQMAH